MSKKINYSSSNFFVVTHTVGEKDQEIFGPGDAFYEFLRKKKTKFFIFLRYGLYDQPYKARMGFFKKGKMVREDFGIMTTSIKTPVRYIFEVFYSVFIALRSRIIFDVWVGCNGLNTVPGIFLKKLGRVRKVIFYTIDYVPTRFPQKILNGIYHRIDRFCLKNSDQVWNNSEVVRQIRKKQGVDDDKNLRVPHGADLSQIIIPPKNLINRNQMVVVGNITQALKFEMMIKSLKKVIEKNKKAQIVLIGTGQSEKEIKFLVKKDHLENHFMFLGRLDHPTLLKELPKFGIGLAIYGNTYDWNLYADSLKVKEYLACGLPVIISGVPATQAEVKKSKAVYIIDIDQNQLTKAMLKLLTDKNLYEEYKNNALSFRQNLDWNKIYNKALSKLIF